MTRVSTLVIVLFSIASAWAQTPAIAPGGVANGASFGLAPSAVTPGSLISVFGTNLASSTAAADSVPLSTNLGSVSVTIGGFPAALNYVCHLCVGGTGDQLNIQMPWEVQGTSTQIVVQNGSTASAPMTIPVAPFNPGIFTVNSGTGIAIAFFPDGTLAAPTGSIPGLNTRPANSGDVLEILATGLGAVNAPIADGANSLDQLRQTSAPGTVLIGGVSAPVAFCGLSPQFVGVDQVNVTVPSGIAPGNSVPLQIQIGGVTSTNQAVIAVAD